jgi:hypothetical protein
LKILPSTLKYFTALFLGLIKEIKGIKELSGKSRYYYYEYGKINKKYLLYKKADICYCREIRDNKKNLFIGKQIAVIIDKKERFTL